MLVPAIFYVLTGQVNEKITFWKPGFLVRTEEDLNTEWGIERENFVLHFYKLYLDFDSVNLYDSSGY